MQLHLLKNCYGIYTILLGVTCGWVYVLPYRLSVEVAVGLWCLTCFSSWLMVMGLVWSGRRYPSLVTGSFFLLSFLRMGFLLSSLLWVKQAYPDELRLYSLLMVGYFMVILLAETTTFITYKNRLLHAEKTS